MHNPGHIKRHRSRKQKIYGLFKHNSKICQPTKESVRARASDTDIFPRIPEQYKWRLTTHSVRYILLLLCVECVDRISERRNPETV